MKDRKKILIVLCVSLLVVFLLALSARILVPKDEPEDLPMEEAELLAYLDEQQLRVVEEEPETLFWTTTPDTAE